MHGSSIVPRACGGAILLVATVVATLVDAAPVAPQRPPPYLDPGLPVAERVADLLGRMTLREKFWQLYMSPGSLDDPSHDYADGAFGLQIDVAPATMSHATSANIARAHAQRINAIQRYFVEETRLGIPIIPFDEALHGLMRPGATAFPQAIALAATWDTALVGEVARAIALETRSRGVRQVLSPVVNIASDTRWGRVEETYGEDPYLSSQMAESFVRAFERAAVVATPKHFVANVGDGGRDSYPIDLSGRLLEEVHFPPFRAALRAGARSVMTAYNSVDGRPATQNHWLLNEKLKDEWGFDGFVISDAAATGGATVLHLTEPSTLVAAKHAWEAGLDVVFQSTWPQHRPYLAALERGLVQRAVIDSAVARVLRVKFELGLFEDPYVDPDEAARLAGHPTHRAIARQAARASLVLLRNEGLLPLRAPRTLAVIGPDATEARLGGYSGPGARPASILTGIRERAGPAAEIRYVTGPGRTRTSTRGVASRYLAGADGEPGLLGEYWSNIHLDGQPSIARRDSVVDFRWTLTSPGRGIDRDWYSARWTGRLTVPEDGIRGLGIEGDDGYRLYLDGRLLIDNWEKRSHGTRMAAMDLEPGTIHDLRLEFFESRGNARLRLVRDAGIENAQAGIDAAVEAARASEVAIIVAGIEEGEFRDRASLDLPGAQPELIRAVAATGTPTVVILVAGSAVAVRPWLGQVDAVLLAWYPGEEGGRAVADVLFGDSEPGGRLPVTFPVAEGQLPLVYNHKPTGRGDDYLDLTGRPEFPFGYGLSYTDFRYSNLEIEPPTTGSRGRVLVRCVVRNVGDRPGDEVVQLYLRDPIASVARPVLWLGGFQPIYLEPGEAREVAFELDADQLSLLDAGLNRVVEPGAFRVLIGRSSADIRLRGILDLSTEAARLLEPQGRG